MPDSLVDNVMRLMHNEENSIPGITTAMPQFLLLKERATPLPQRNQLNPVHQTRAITFMPVMQKIFRMFFLVADVS